MRHTFTFLALAAIIFSTACIEKETRHTLYLSPDGSLTWTVLESDIRSVDPDPQERAREDRQILESYEQHRHPLGEALELLEPVETRSRMLREEPPYWIWTSARYVSLGSMMECLMDQINCPADISMRAENGVVHFRMEIFHQADGAGHCPEEIGNKLAQLLDDLEDYRLVLSDGKFVSSHGFRLESNNRVAVPLEPEDGAETFIFSLSWTDDNLNP